MLKLLFADDQVTVPTLEDILQKAAYKLRQTITDDLTSFVEKAKLTAFKRQKPVRSKTLIDNKIIENVNSLNFLGSLISYEKEVDMNNQMNTYLKITGIINNMFRPLKT
jgi:hypothetical protein